MITPDTIALVKERTDLVALIGETVRLTRRGRSFTGLCPFHKEKSPSFHVNPERGFYHCFGCKESGSAVDFMMKTLGLTFPEAIRDLAERGGIAIEETATDAEQREAGAARRAKDDLYAVNHLAATFFERSLRANGGHPLALHARAELAKRGLPLGEASAAPEGGPIDPITDALQAFRIGYAPLAWDGLTAFLKQQGVSPIAAEKVGLLVPRSSGTGHYDRFRHRLMFAVVDVMGRVVAFSGRALADPTPDELASFAPAMARAPGAADRDGPPAKYINSPESPIYTKGDHLFGLHQARHAIRQQAEAIVVEGNFDVVALHARGIKNVVAPLGTAFTVAQAKLLKRFAPAVVIVFDGDAAGKKATRAARAPCQEGDLTARVARLPAGMDPDDLARKHGPEAILSLVKGAKGMLEHLIEDALDDGGFHGSSMHEQLARIRAVLQLLSSENDPNLRSMAKRYADHFAARILVNGESAIDLHQLEHLVEQATSHPTHDTAASRRDARERENGSMAPANLATRASSVPRIEQISLDVVGALLDFPELLDDAEVVAALDALEGDATLAIAAMRQTRFDQKGLYADEFLAQIPAPIHSFAAGRLALPVFEAADEAKSRLFENARKLKRLSLSRENVAVLEELQRAEALGDVASEDALLREIGRRSREKRGLG